MSAEKSRHKPNVRLSLGICELCRAPFRGRQDKRFCRDACRTRFGRGEARTGHAGTAGHDRAAGPVGWPVDDHLTRDSNVYTLEDSYNVA